MNAAKVFSAWILVGVPLIYGVSQTLAKVPALFAG
jgi:hypothetical protein